VSNLEDPRIIEGMRRQGELLADFRARGARLTGYKAGLGAAAAMARLTLSAPVAGFLTDATAVQSSGTVTIDGWANPTFEPELAVRLGADLGAGHTAQEALAAIDAIAPAIELVDLGAPDDVAAVLAGDIFHRAYVIGPITAADPAAVDAARLRVTIDGETRAAGVEPAQVLGPVGEVVARLADQVGLAGCAMAAGEVIITGSAIAAIALSGPGRLEVSLQGAGSVALDVISA
jgi:2-keto-4-pentenoate hydratase